MSFLMVYTSRPSTIKIHQYNPLILITYLKDQIINLFCCTMRIQRTINRKL